MRTDNRLFEEGRPTEGRRLHGRVGHRCYVATCGCRQDRSPGHAGIWRDRHDRQPVTRFKLAETDEERAVVPDHGGVLSAADADRLGGPRDKLREPPNQCQQAETDGGDALHTREYQAAGRRTAAS